MWYDVGTVSVTNGSTTVTGAGTDFISGVQVGEGLYIGGDLYEIGVINSSTQLTLSDAYLGSTATGQAYKIIPTQSLVADLSSGVADLISDFADVRDYAGNGKFNDGTQASPAITFTQDQNNGLYRIGSDNWGLAAGGAKALEIKTTGVKLDDGKKITFGASDDLQIYHDGSNSYITDAGTGSLIIDGSSSTQIKGSSFVILRSSAGENMAVGNADGAFDVYYDGAKKLATTATGVDVTGTITADGLTVDGDSNLGSTTKGVQFTTLGAGSYKMVGGNSAVSSASFTIDAKAIDTAVLHLATDGVNHLSIAQNGDVSFYEDTGTTAKFVWDASAERLGIGTTAPFTTLALPFGAGIGIGDASINTTVSRSAVFPRVTTIADSYNNASSRIDFTMRAGATEENTPLSILASGNVGIGTASPADKIDIYSLAGGLRIGSSANSANIAWNNASTSMQIEAKGANWPITFRQNGTERARIDSSGNLLVGTTSTSQTTAGFRVFSSGRINASDGTVPIIADRLSTDGEVIRIAKDSATVGTIGSYGGDLTIGKVSTTLKFNDGLNVIHPNGTGGGSDGITTLGWSNRRFKDLYLSGGVITSSDYRLKEDIQPMQSYADTVKQMNLVNFAWKESGKREDGFIAHELQALVPSAVRGDKDAINEDGEAQHQGVDPLKIIPVLAKALQEALERIEILENK